MKIMALPKWKIENDLCRCCHSEGACTNLSEPRIFDGEKEVYSEMIQECFSINISPVEGELSRVTYGICKNCANRVRDAINFKKQVLECEKRFGIMYSKNCIVESGNNLKGDSENKSEDDDDFYYPGGFDSNDEQNSDEELENELKKIFSKATSKKTEKDDFNRKTDSEKSKTEKKKIEKQRSAATKAETEDDKPAKKEKDGEMQTRSRKQQEVEFNIEPTEDAVTLKEVTLEKERVYNKHISNVREILINSNATPIRSFTDLGYKCYFCDKYYLNAADLKKHTIENHDKAYHAKAFKKRQLKDFLLKLDITNLRCSKCNQCIETLEELLNHLTTVHAITIFTDIKNQIIPMKFETDNLQCFLCLHPVTCFRILQSHLSNHYPNYRCEICSSPFINMGRLETHVRHIHKKGTFKCDFCPKVFDTLNKKNVHDRNEHRRSSTFKCKYCGEDFLKYRDKRAHMSKEHKIIRILNCQACNKTFKTIRTLRIHTERDHLMIRNFKCTECDETFYQASELDDHMVKHRGSKDFLCEICPKSFFRRNTLNEHLKIHSNDRKFKCDICGLGFVFIYRWKSHMRSRHGKAFDSVHPQ